MEGTWSKREGSPQRAPDRGRECVGVEGVRKEEGQGLAVRARGARGALVRLAQGVLLLLEVVQGACVGARVVVTAV